MSAILKQLSEGASALDTKGDKSSGDGDAPDTCTDHGSHQVFTPSVFKVGTDAEGEFTFNYKGELIKPECIPLETRVSVISEQVIWPSFNNHVNRILAGENMNYRATFIHRKIVDLADRESKCRCGMYVNALVAALPAVGVTFASFEGDRDTAQKTWLHYSKVWSQAQQAGLVPSGSTVAPSSTSVSQKPGSNALPPTN